MKSKPCPCFLAYKYGKNLCENDIIKIVCSPLSSLLRVLTKRNTLLITVCRFIKSHNNKSFFELACSVRIGKILVSFLFWKFMDRSTKFQKKVTRPMSSHCGPHTSSITYMSALIPKIF